MPGFLLIQGHTVPGSQWVLWAGKNHDHSIFLLIRRSQAWTYIHASLFKNDLTKLLAKNWTPKMIGYYPFSSLYPFPPIRNGTWPMLGCCTFTAARIKNSHTQGISLAWKLAWHFSTFSFKKQHLDYLKILNCINKIIAKIKMQTTNWKKTIYSKKVKDKQFVTLLFERPIKKMS